MYPKKSKAEKKLARRENRREDRKWERAYKYNEHHIIFPKSRGGTTDPKNLITFDINRHNAWHLLFSNMTLEEVIELLERVRDCQRNRKCKCEHKRTK